MYFLVQIVLDMDLFILFVELMHFSLCFQIGHVTKTGDIAGPRVLEHIVDVVLYMEVGTLLLISVYFIWFRFTSC